MKISIIITVYNRENTLSRAIDSALSQDYENKEVIIVDDGSIDRSVDIINGYSDVDFLHAYFKCNGGAASAKNYGVNNCSGDFVVFLDSDDYFYHDRVISVIANKIRSGCDFVTHSMIIKGLANGDKVHTWIPRISNEFTDYILSSPLHYPGLPPYCIKKTLYIESGGMDESTKWGDAISFWRHLFKKNINVGVIDSIGYYYDQTGEDTISSASGDKKRKMKYASQSLYSAYQQHSNDLRLQHQLSWMLYLIYASIRGGEHYRAIFFLRKLLDFPLKDVIVVSAKSFIERVKK